MLCRLLFALLAVAPLAASEPTPVVVPGESRTTATKIDEGRKLIAAKKGAEAITLFQGLIESNGDDLVALPEGRSVCARLLCQEALARLGAADLDAYRRRCEPAARRLLEGNTDAARLRVVDEYFCTRAALAALDQLGDAAFLRGAFEEAEGYWRRMAPLEAVEGALSYPDAPAEVAARAGAKQLLARLFRGRPGWQADLDAYLARHPKAAGRLAGRTGPYADTLRAVAAERRKAAPPVAGDHPTFGGSPARNDVRPASPALLGRLSRIARSGPTWRFSLEDPAAGAVNDTPPAHDHQVAAARRLAFYPVVVGHLALTTDGRFITAYNLRTGKASRWYDVAEYVGGLRRRGVLPAVEDLRHSLSVAEGCVFARLGVHAVQDVRPDPRKIGKPGGFLRESTESVLVSLSLRPGPDGTRRRWLVRAIDHARKEHAVFEGAPVVADGRVWIAASRFEGDKVVTAVHCYPAHPEDTAPLPLWRTDVCQTQELATATSSDIPRRLRRRQHLLTLAGDRLVYCSHSGAIVAIDARSGRRVWALRYPRRDAEPEEVPALRDLAPPVFADGRVYVAPADSDRLYCLDAQTGAILWQRDRLDAVHLLGVGSGRLIFSTWRNPRQGQLYAGGLRAVRAADGSDEGGWSLPDDGGGLVPYGRGILVGELVLWPTARRPYGVFAIRQDNGRQPDNPTLLHRIPSGNLIFANGCLLVADRLTLSAFVPPEILPDEGGKLSLLDEAERAVAARRWSRADELFRRAAVGSPQQRLNALVRAARAWEAAEAYGRAAAVWQGVVASPELRDRPLADETGLPQRAGWLAGRALRRRGLLPNVRPPETPRRQSPPALRLPLALDGEVVLGVGERFLPAEGCHAASAQYLFSAVRDELLARSRRDGRLTWRATLPFDVSWAAGFGPLLVVAGSGGMATVAAQNGDVHWAMLAPFPLTVFRLVGPTLVVGSPRRLLGIDVVMGATRWQRFAPGAGFEMPPPRGTFHHLVAVGDDRLLAQASGRCLVIDTNEGKATDLGPTSLTPWPRPPVVLDESRVLIVPDNAHVRLIEAEAGKVVWTHRLSGRTTRSGEPPLVAASADAAVVAVPLNIACRLQRLDLKTGKPMWPTAPLVAVDRLEPAAWLVGQDAFYHVDAGRLYVRALADGRVSGERLLDRAAWRLARSGGTLLAWHDREPALRFRFRWLTGTLQYQAGPCPAGGVAALVCLDAGTADLVQRVNLEIDRLSSSRDFRPGRAGVFPWPAYWRDAEGSPGLAVVHDAGGVLVSLGDRVKSLRPDVTPSSRNRER